MSMAIASRLVLRHFFFSALRFAAFFLAAFFFEAFFDGLWAETELDEAALSELVEGASPGFGASTRSAVGW